MEVGGGVGGSTNDGGERLRHRQAQKRSPHP